MNKKFLIFIFSILLLFSLASCKNDSVEDVKKQIVEILGYTPNDMNIVGKYGEGYFIDINSNGIKGEDNFYIDGVYIPKRSFMDYQYFLINNKLYYPETAYNLGYLVKEDLYNIQARYYENRKDINVDYPLVDPNEHVKRCIHEVDDWKIVKQPTCVNNGKKILLCKKCDKELYSIELYKESHNYINGKCVFCKEAQYRYINTYKEHPDDMISFLGGYQFQDSENYSNVFYVKTEKTFTIHNGSIENLIFPSNDLGQIIVYDYGKRYHPKEEKEVTGLKIISLVDAYDYGWINKNMLFEIYEKLKEVSIAGKYCYDNYDLIAIPSIKQHEKYYYKDYVTNSFAEKEFLRICDEEYKIKKYFQSNIQGFFYGIYNGYYVGTFDNYPFGVMGLKMEETTLKIGKYKFILNKYEDLIVCNENEIYDLKTAYRKKIISEEDLDKIYKAHVHKKVIIDKI